MQKNEGKGNLSQNDSDLDLSSWVGGDVQLVVDMYSYGGRGTIANVRQRSPESHFRLVEMLDRQNS
jgi:hypothetical protein